MKLSVSKRYYFVDEAGDGTLFSRRGKIIIGQEGCSRFFMLGFVDLLDPSIITGELAQLRQELLADPYFQTIPSMQPHRRKTALYFHAKDDIPEVRWEVFKILRRHSDKIRFLAVIRDKREVLSYVLQRNENDSAYRYHPNELYDYMVRRLFKNMLHKDDEYDIFFAARGKSDRTKALQTALQTARQRFAEQWGVSHEPTIHIIPSTPAQTGGLQVADYFLWALQRLYERGEDRYVLYLQPAFRFIHDIDDTRNARYGMYYTRKKPLTLEALKGRITWQK